MDCLFQVALHLPSQVGRDRVRHGRDADKMKDMMTDDDGYNDCC